MRFSVRTRESEDERGSLFARLPDTAARLLHSQALHHIHVGEEREVKTAAAALSEEGWWTVPSELSSSTTSGVEFLPLRVEAFSAAGNDELCLDGADANLVCNAVYCSYNGGSTSDDKGDDAIIELDPTIDPSLSDSKCSIVSIQPLHRIKDATTVQIEPLTPSDWELIEMHSSDLEGGGLLRQVSVVFPSQILSIRLGVRDVAMVRVLPDAFDGVEEEDARVDCSDSFNKDEGGSRTGQTCSYECLRLVANTEVVVVPKVRPSSASTSGYAPSRPLRAHPTEQDFTPEMKELLSSKFHSNTVNGNDESILLDCPAQFTVKAHPSTLKDFVPGWEDMTGNGSIGERQSEPSALAIVRKAPREAEGSQGTNPITCTSDFKPELGDPSVAVARVYSSSRVPYGHVALHTNLRYQLGVSPLYDHVGLQLIPDTQIEQSYDMLKKRIQSGEILIEFIPVDSFTPRSSHIRKRPWRYPSGSSLSILSIKQPLVSSNATSRGGRVHGGQMSISSLLAESCRGKDDKLPLTSGSLITLPFFATQQEGNKRATFRLAFKLLDGQRVGGETIAPAVDDGRHSLSFPAVLVKQIHSLILLAGNCDGPLVTASNERSGRSPVEFGLPENETIINLLPSNAACIHAVVDMSATLAMSLQTKVTSMLITGEMGSGKTHFALSIAAQLRLRRSCATTYLDCRRLQSSPQLRMRGVLEELTCAFEEACIRQPSVLLLDDLDALVPNVESGIGDDDGAVHHQQISPALISQVKTLCDHIQFLMEKTVEKCSNVCAVSVIGTCRDQSSIAPLLRSAKIFSTAVEVPSLDAKHRTDLFDAILKRRCSEELENEVVPTNSMAQLVPSFGKETEGFRACDLHGLASRVAHLTHVRTLGRIPHQSGCSPLSPSMLHATLRVSTSDIHAALSSFTPISHQSLHLENQPVNRSWSSVGGLFKAKASLTDVMLQPVRYSMIFQAAPISLPRGLLLYGPPGCGKTYMLPALAQECNFNLVTCRGPELLDKYIGASEAKVRQLFARAYAAAPAILFLDDFDALAPRRGTDHTGVTDRVVNQLLTFLDGVESSGRKGGMIYIVAATSRPDKIDPALLRPGRLEKHIYVGYPESRNEWNDLFLKASSTRELSGDARDFIASGDLLQSFGNNLKHIKAFSAADMKAVFDTAHLASVHEFLERSGGALTPDVLGPDISRKHLIDALCATRPSLSAADKRLFAGVYKPFYIGPQGDASAVPPLGDLNHADGDFASGPHAPSRQSLEWNDGALSESSPALRTTLR